MATMNISRQSISGICNTKCNLSFDYPESNCTASNHGNLIQLSYDNGSVPPVKYNNIDYNVQNVAIVSPSRHLYNGQQLPGEIFIKHISTNAAPIFIICVPIMVSETSDTMLEEIINQVATGAANSGESTTIKTDYTLNNIVPTKPFFNYTSDNQEVVVYGLITAANLNRTTIQTLRNLVTALPPILEGPKLFVNTTGPNKKTNSGEIYIDCKPTGSSEETTQVTEEKSEPVSYSFSLESILKNPIFLFLISGSLFILLIFIFSAILSYSIQGKVPSLSELKDKFSKKGTE
jgi:hypothetical protein